MASKPPRPGIWQAEVFSRIDELRGRLAAVEATKKAGVEGAEEEAVHAAVKKSLDNAETAADAEWWQRPKAWWTGSAITEAWEGVHHAELALIGIEGEEGVKAILARLLAWVQTAIEEPERRKRHEETLKKELQGTATLNRTVVRQAFVDVIAANRERYANLRTFRNILILITGLLILLVVAASVWHALNPAFLTLCPKGAKVCLTSPPRTEVAIVALLGAIGGSLGLAFGFTETDAAPSRYDPKAWQAFLKPVTGAVTGILGVMLVQAEFLIPPAGNASSALLVYAVIFGFSQQLLTRAVDKQADALIAPEKAS